MIARLTWQPDNIPGPETLTVDLGAQYIQEFRDLIGTEEWATGEAVAWINTQDSDGSWTPRLYRLARITALEPA